MDKIFLLLSTVLGLRVAFCAVMLAQHVLTKSCLRKIKITIYRKKAKAVLVFEVNSHPLLCVNKLTFQITNFLVNFASLEVAMFLK